MGPLITTKWCVGVCVCLCHIPLCVCVQPMKIHISEVTAELLQGTDFVVEERGKVEVKVCTLLHRPRVSQTIASHALFQKCFTNKSLA